MRRAILALSIALSASFLWQNTAEAQEKPGDRIKLDPQTEPAAQGAATPAGQPPLRGLGAEGSPSGTTGDTSTAAPIEAPPGADEVMDRNLIMVAPPGGAKQAEKPKPLSAIVGASLTMKIEQTDIKLNGLTGVKVLVINDTARPLVVDGDSAEVTANGKSYSAASLRAVEQCVMKEKGAAALIKDFITRGIPAAATIGALPTAMDINNMRKPVRERYGEDERRRVAEESRFGKRIVWPRQKTTGVLYVLAPKSTGLELKGSEVKIPVHSLFDSPDKASLDSK